MKQLILPLELPPAFEEKDFIVSSTNEEAYCWLMKWPHWPHPCLSIYGEEGCGKTHLSHIFQKDKEVRYLKSQEFNETPLESLLEGPQIFSLDDGHLIEQEEKLFHLYNHLMSINGNLLLLSRIPPAHWKTSLPDLHSRLNTIPAVRILAPDEAFLAQVIQKLFTDLQLKIEDSVLCFLLKHMERSFESARFWVETLNKCALIQKRSITIPLVREILLEKEKAQIYL